MKKEVIMAASAVATLASSTALSQSALPTSLEPRLAPVMNQCPEMSDPDREFGGNGPNVDMNAWIRRVSGNQEIELELNFQAEESVSDWSEAVERQSQRKRGVLVAPQCTVYTSINSGTYNWWSYHDTDHAIDDFSSSLPDPLVTTFRARGDTSNSDIGNCTSDDTKFWVFFNESDVTLDIDPSCKSEDDTDAEAEKAPPTRAQLVEQAINDLATRVAMRLDNVDFPTGGSSHTLAQNSYFGIEMPPPDSPVNTPFDLVPYNDGGRFTFLFDDINANPGSATIEPDGGGYMIKFNFETAGTEVRSLCEERLFHPDFGFESKAGKTAQDIANFLANGWKLLGCALGGEYTS